MRSTFRTAVCTAVGLCPPVAAQAPADRALVADIDRFITTIFEATGAPGMAVAVVLGDQPVLVRGYGFADLERRIPVTEHTGFYIASTTKAFTALAVALMADRGTLDLDAPITRYLSDATWAPNVRPDSLTLRMLLDHTHGLAGNGPVVWRTAYSGVHDNALLKRLLQHHPAAGTAGRYQYTNLGYNIAGIIIDQVTGSRWQDILDATVFQPLGMTRTSAYVSRFDSAALAIPYVMDPGGPRRVHYAKSDGNMQAAGGLVSTAADLARWLELQMNAGRLDGRQVVPASVLAETQRIQVPASGNRDDMQVIGYSLGWLVATLDGDTIHTHGGGFSAFRTAIAFDRRRRVGVALMTSEANLAGSGLNAMAEYVLRRTRDSAATVARYAELVTQLPDILAGVRSRIAQDRQRRAARPQTLNHPMEAYAGAYESPEGGTMVWRVRDGRLWAEIGALLSVAEVFDHAADRLRVELEPGSGQVVSFRFEGDRAVGLSYGGMEFNRR